MEIDKERESVVWGESAEYERWLESGMRVTPIMERWIRALGKGHNICDGGTSMSREIHPRAQIFGLITQSWGSYLILPWVPQWYGINFGIVPPLKGGT